MVVGEIIPRELNIDVNFCKVVYVVRFLISDGISTADKSLFVF